MRVLQLVASFAYSGPAEPMLSLSQALAARGHQVTVGHDTVRPDGNAHEEGFGPRVAQSGLPVARELRLCTQDGPLRWLQDMGALRRRLPDLDVVHVHFSHDHVIAAGARRGLRRPVVVRTVHSERSLRPRPFQGTLLKTADALVVHSREAAGKAAALGVDPTRVHVMHGTVDAKRFHPGDREERRRRFREAHGLPPDVPAVAMVAIFQKGRGHEQLVDAWANAARNLGDMELWFAGLGEERPRIMADVERRGIPRVRFLGYLKEDLPDVYAAVDATVILAIGNDGFGRAALESLASGTPVVAAAHAPLAEMLEGTTAGILVPPGDTGTLGAALEEIHRAGPARRARMGAEGRARVETQHTPECLVQRTEELYRHLVGGGR